MLGAGPELPEGFRYRPDVISPDKEQGLLEGIRELPLTEFQFHAWLLPLREVAAGFAGIAPEQLQQALVTEYDVGAAIGWNRDKAVFGDVIGVSLLSSCRFRLRRKVGEKWERASLVADARSAYLLRGPSRTEWEHSIPGVDALRYSITFREVRQERQRQK